MACLDCVKELRLLFSYLRKKVTGPVEREMQFLEELHYFLMLRLLICQMMYLQRLSSRIFST